MPPVAFGVGTRWFAGDAHNLDDAPLNESLIGQIAAAVQVGFRHFDLAEMYTPLAAHHGLNVMSLPPTLYLKLGCSAICLLIALFFIHGVWTRDIVLCSLFVHRYGNDRETALGLGLTRAALVPREELWLTHKVACLDFLFIYYLFFFCHMISLVHESRIALHL
jgi:hypothetical protein